MRTFKLRNGAIAIEAPRRDDDYENGYCRVVRIVKEGDSESVEYGSVIGETLALLFGTPPNILPEGGAHGRGFDVVEEIESESA